MCVNKPTVLVQAVRSMQPSGGISGVAFQLARTLQGQYLQLETITGERPQGRWAKISIGKISEIKTVVWLTQRLRGYFRVNLTVIFFSILASWIFRNRNQNSVTLSHGDTFLGDIFVAHSCHWAAIHTKIKRGERRWIFNPMHWFVLVREAWVFRKGHFRYLITISKSIAEEFQHYHHVPVERIKVILNGVDIDRFTPEHRPESRQSVLTELALPPETVILLFVGHEFSRKGLEPLIQVLPNIRNDNRKIILLVLGRDDPSPFKQLAKRIGVANSVRFLGTRSDAERFMQAADIFLFPTNYEPFGLVGIEALACGTPVLATKTGGIIEYLEDGVNGFFIERNPKDIAQKISSLLNDPVLKKTMEIAARKTAEEFSCDKMAKQYLKVIQEVIQEKKAGQALC